MYRAINLRSRFSNKLFTKFYTEIEISSGLSARFYIKTCSPIILNRRSEITLMLYIVIDTITSLTAEGEVIGPTDSNYMLHRLWSSAKNAP